jgi:hypothetical protein
LTISPRDERCANAEVEADLTIGEFVTEQLRSTPRAQRPDLLFPDIQMDTLTGIELARALDTATAADCRSHGLHNYVQVSELNAIDIICSTIDLKRFKATLSRIRQRFSEAQRGKTATLSWSRCWPRRAKRARYSTSGHAIARRVRRYHAHARCSRDWRWKPTATTLRSESGEKPFMPAAHCSRPSCSRADVAPQPLRLARI